MGDSTRQSIVSGPMAAGVPRGRIAEDGVIPAKYHLNEMASPEYLPRNKANVGMVGGFAAMTGAITKASVEHAIKENFPGKLGELNAVVAAETFDYVSSIVSLTSSNQ